VQKKLFLRLPQFQGSAFFSKKANEEVSLLESSCLSPGSWFDGWTSLWSLPYHSWGCLGFFDGLCRFGLDDLATLSLEVQSIPTQ
jgi:hypothetical protein